MDGISDRVVIPTPMGGARRLEGDLEGAQNRPPMCFWASWSELGPSMVGLGGLCG